MKKQIILTFITEFIVLASALLVYKLAANVFLKEEFSEYVIARRVITFLVPIVLMGMTIEMPKHLVTGGKSAEAYYAGGLMIILTFSLLLCLFLNLFSSHIAYFLFGNAKYSDIIFPITVMLFGLMTHSGCYSFFRGSLDMTNANIIQIINGALVPALVFYAYKSPGLVILATGILQSLVSLMFFIKIMGRIKNKIVIKIACIKILLFYGMQRVPGDMGLAGLLMLPATIAAHIGGINAGGSVAFSISLLNMVGAIFSPLGLVLLPRVRLIVQKRDYSTLKLYLLKIFKTSLILGILTLAAYEIFADFILEVYLGKRNADLEYLSRLIMIACPFYILSLSLRSVIDAYYVKPVNARNILISLTFFLLSSLGLLAGAGVNYLIACFVMSMAVLSGLTLYESYALFKLNRS